MLSALVIGIDGRDLLGAGEEALGHFGRGAGLKRLRRAERSLA